MPLITARNFGRKSIFCCGGCGLVLATVGLALRGQAADQRQASTVVVEIQPEMGQPLSGLTAEQLQRFEVGATAFDKEFSVAEGRGPIFNQVSCGNCHNTPLGGSSNLTVTRFGAASKGGFDSLDQFGGSLLQEEQISDECGEDIPLEANVIAKRLTNSTLGFGLLEAIPDADLLALADPMDLNADGISGKAHMVEAFEDPGTPRVGRFGWKSQVPTVLTFSADAALQEMGITNRFVIQENDPNGINPPEIGDCDTVPDPEDGPDDQGFDFIDRVTDFQRFLSAPPQTPKYGMTGEALFISIGCADCHVRAHATPDDPALEDAIRNKDIYPYSNFLLHEMGQGADFIAQGDAQSGELRTPPLWGLRVRDPMWHDGRAAAIGFTSRIERVMRWHCALGSEARPSAQRFLSGRDFTGDTTCMDLNKGPCPCTTNGAVAGGLDEAQRTQVIAFLDSLGRAEFDFDGDRIVDLDEDFQSLQDCAQLQVAITPDDPCAVHDINQDGMLDGIDFEAYVSVIGQDDDCDCNGVNDLLDILNGTSSDVDGDGVPDECTAGNTPLCSVEYALDIREGKCPNKFKITTGGGDLKAHIAGAPDSDVNLIDLGSIRLRRCGGDESVSPSKPPRIKDKVTPLLTVCGDCSCHKKKKDYIDDVEIKFRKSDVSSLIDESVIEGTLVDLEVYGTLLDGTSFTAHDCVLVDRPGGAND